MKKFKILRFVLLIIFFFGTLSLSKTSLAEKTEGNIGFTKTSSSESSSSDSTSTSESQILIPTSSSKKQEVVAVPDDNGPEEDIGSQIRKRLPSTGAITQPVHFALGLLFFCLSLYFLNRKKRARK